MMEMAEQIHSGRNSDSLLFVGHFDHPDMCLDGLAGCLAGHEAVARLSERRTQLTYRMLSTVEIIGSAFYAERELPSRSVRQALFVATAGACAPLCYQESFTGQASTDRVVRHVLRHSAPDAMIYPFREGPLGNDEIAYDVAGVNVPAGSLMRAPFEGVEEHARVVTMVPDAVERRDAVLTTCASRAGSTGSEPTLSPQRQ
jgi:aminopeptidase-like protein